MKFDPQKHHRRSIRLKGYDYTQAGAYFVTICTWHRECLFGEIQNSEMQLNRFGEAVPFIWNRLPKSYPYVELDAFIIMPNHLHGIFFLIDETPIDGYSQPSMRLINKETEATPTSGHSQRHSLSEIVRGLKTFSGRRINQLRSTTGVSVWQRGYYEHIIRNEESLQYIRQYIFDNPSAWEQHQLHPDRSFPLSPQIHLNLGCSNKLLMQLCR